jgi:hypothetical protein
MTDPNHSKPGQRPGSGGPAKPTSAPAAPTASNENAAPEGSSGKVVHDSRGNAVWQWVKDTGRQAIESTSALLKKLEMPELKVEDHKDTDLRLEEDVDKGGGYDPYGTRVGSRKPTERKTLPPIPRKR